MPMTHQFLLIMMLIFVERLVLMLWYYLICLLREHAVFDVTSSLRGNLSELWLTCHSVGFKASEIPGNHLLNFWWHFMLNFFFMLGFTAKSSILHCIAFLWTTSRTTTTIIGIAVESLHVALPIYSETMKGSSHLLRTDTAHEISMYNHIEVKHYKCTCSDKTGGLWLMLALPSQVLFVLWLFFKRNSLFRAILK